MITKKEVEEVALGASEMMRKFIGSCGLEVEVVIAISPVWDPVNVVCASTADIETTERILHSYIRSGEDEKS